VTTFPSFAKDRAVQAFEQAATTKTVGLYEIRRRGTGALLGYHLSEWQHLMPLRIERGRFFVPIRQS
jgi:streptomycin 6-kinase